MRILMLECKQVPPITQVCVEMLYYTNNMKNHAIPFQPIGSTNLKFPSRVLTFLYHLKRIIYAPVSFLLCLNVKNFLNNEIFVNI